MNELDNEKNTPGTPETPAVQNTPEATPPSPAVTPEQAPMDVAHSSTENITPEPQTPAFLSLKNPTLIALLVGILILALAAYYVYDTSYRGGGTVAVVNGERIFAQELAESIRLFEENAKLQGIDLTTEEAQAQVREEALQVLIDNRILLGGARTSGFEASEEEIQEKLTLLNTEMGGEEALKARMEQVGLTEERLRQNITERILVDHFIEAETDIEAVSVTDEELQGIYASLKKSSPDIPPLAEITDALTEQILAQKRQDAVLSLLNRVRNEASIEIK